MCLSLAIERPGDVLAKGEHVGFEWMVIHNGMGFRCGYVKVGPGHPWHGKTDGELSDLDCHGGVTFAEPDTPCEAGGPDSGYWIGFDCAHALDRRDRALPLNRYGDASDVVVRAFEEMDALDTFSAVRTQEYVEDECRSLCEQAARAKSEASPPALFTKSERGTRPIAVSPGPEPDPARISRAPRRFSRS